MTNTRWKLLIGTFGIGVAVSCPLLFPAAFATATTASGVGALLISLLGASGGIAGNILSDGICDYVNGNTLKDDTPPIRDLARIIGDAFSQILSEECHNPECAGSANNIDNIARVSPDVFRRLLLEHDLDSNEPFDLHPFFVSISQGTGIPPLLTVDVWKDWLRRISAACGASLDRQSSDYLGIQLHRKMFQRIREKLALDFQKNGEAYPAFHILCLDRLLNSVAKSIDLTESVLNVARITAHDVTQIKDVVVGRIGEVRAALPVDQQLQIQFTFDEVLRHSAQLTDAAAGMQRIETKIDALLKMMADDQERLRGENDTLRQALQEIQAENQSLRETSREALRDLVKAAEAGEVKAQLAINEYTETRNVETFKRFFDRLTNQSDDLADRAMEDAEQAAQIAQDAQDQACERHRQRASLMLVVGDLDRAFESLQRILRMRPDDVLAILELGHLFRLRGDFAAARVQFLKLLELGPDNLAIKSTALSSLGLIEQLTGDLDKSEMLHKESLAIDETIGATVAKGICFGNLGLIALLRGKLEEAEDYFRQSLEINLQFNNFANQARDYGNLALIAQTRGHLEQAEILHNQSLDIDNRIGRLEGQAKTLGNLGVIFRQRGRLDDAEKSVLKALEINKTLKSLDGQARNFGNLANIADDRGDLNKAEQLVTDALNIERRIGDRAGEAGTLNNLAAIQFRRDKIDEAERLYHEVGILITTLDRPDIKFLYLLGLGNISFKRDNWDEAKQLYSEALAISVQVGMIGRQAMALQKIALVALATGDRATAYYLFRQSQQKFYEVGDFESGNRIEGLFVYQEYTPPQT